jgi:hypothetical protein
MPIVPQREFLIKPSRNQNPVARDDVEDDSLEGALVARLVESLPLPRRQMLVLQLGLCCKGCCTSPALEARHLESQALVCSLWLPRCSLFLALFLR